jgi:KUP system potassium uptake protein
MVTLKYVVIILNADNEGEGGTFSTYSLLTRYVSSTPSAKVPTKNLTIQGQYHTARS